MRLLKIDRADGTTEIFIEGSREFADEYKRIREIYSPETGRRVDRDFKEALRHGQFASMGFLYKLEDRRSGA